MSQYATDFTEYTLNAQPSDWTKRWATSASPMEVRDSAGTTVLFMDAPNGTEYALSWDDIDADSNRATVQVYCEVRFAAFSAQTEPNGGIMVRAGAGRDGYYVGPASSSQFRLRKVVAGTESTLNTATVSSSALVWYGMLLEASGTTIRAKTWDLSGSEPGAWDISVTDSDITAAGWVGLMVVGAAPEPEFRFFGVGTNGDAAPRTVGGAATAVTLTGPTSGTSGVASSNFTVGADGAITGDVVVTPSDGGDGGTFTPTTVTINSGSPTGTFTYTPASTGTKTISVTNDGGLTNPSSISYTSSAPAENPVITSQPTNQTVKRGQTATFTVAATGSGTVTYQWQRNPGGVGSWADISGATSASYTTPATTISGGSANDQDDYRCNVSDDDAGPVATDVVTLTVQQCVLALNSAGYEFGDGNDPATMSVVASTELQVAAYPLTEWPPASAIATATATTGTNGRLADLGDDDLIFGTTYRVIARNAADGETWAWTMAAS